MCLADCSAVAVLAAVPGGLAFERDLSKTTLDIGMGPVTDLHREVLLHSEKLQL